MGYVRGRSSKGCADTEQLIFEKVYISPDKESHSPGLKNGVNNRKQQWDKRYKETVKQYPLSNIHWLLENSR